MWTGWNHPPDSLTIVHCSTLNGMGLANSSLNPVASTSSQVTPLTIHSPLLRSNLS